MFSLDFEVYYFGVRARALIGLVGKCYNLCAILLRLRF